MPAKLSKVDEWWAALTIGQKERIARNAAQQLLAASASQNVISAQQLRLDCAYPACSRWWISLSDDDKLHIKATTTLKP